MAEQEVVRRLAAILVADAAGYSRLMGDDEVGTHNQYKSDLELLLKPCISNHRGRIIKTTGDGLLAEFASVIDAVECADGMQRKMSERDAEDPDTPRLAYRIGIHLGEVIVESNDIYGDDVNIAVRLEQLAEPGGICLSSAAYQSVRNRLKLRFEDLGEQVFKNISEPVRIFRVDVGRPRRPASGGRANGALYPLPARPSIAVMPFANLSGDPEQSYFSDGITEDIITELSRFRSLFVIARNSSFAYQGKAVAIQQVGRELGVQFVLEGSVRKAGHRVRITTQLLDALQATNLWAERYDRDLEDIFAVQDEVTQTIVSTLAGRLESAAVERSKGKRTENLAAYDYLLRGVEHFNRLTSRDNDEACKLFEKAIELDPGYALAHAYLASTHLYRWFWDPSAEPLGNTVVEIAQRALNLDENEARCHMIFGRVQLYRRQFSLAEHHHERGIALNPNDADGAAQMGVLLTFLGRPGEAIEWLNKAIRLNPYHPDWYYEDLGQALYTAKRYEEAAAVLERITALPFWVQAWRAACYAQMGRIERARAIAAALNEDIQKLDWDRYPIEKEPYREDGDREHWLGGLRKAGLGT